MSRLRDAYNFVAGPSVGSGMQWGEWLRVLRENRFRVHPLYAIRAFAATGCAISNSVIARRERRNFAGIESVEPDPPIFILGHWRSGTTHLHNLLSLDGRFAYPNCYQVLFPHSFLSTETTMARRLRPFVYGPRIMDNMTQDVTSPMEDEFATVPSGCTPYLGMAFPQRRAHYDRFHTFRGVPEKDVQRWRDSLMMFVKKLWWLCDRPLMLKSPPHTGRIKLLLSMFPQAKFVHIHRHPFAVYQSTIKLNRQCVKYMALQRYRVSDEDARVLPVYKDMYDAFFEERPLIPDGHFHEVRFEDLEHDPIGQLRLIYERLSLPNFERVRPRVEEYLATIAGYRKNKFPHISDEARHEITRWWQRSFEEWKYAPQVG